ncbi:hypothetical protein BTVI_21854 [Pitangus sulphuratus]|nr:hypothetical protein BTVI_21854 [Pitangus sulphuratus]
MVNSGHLGEEYQNQHSIVHLASSMTHEVPESCFGHSGLYNIHTVIKLSWPKGPWCDQALQGLTYFSLVMVGPCLRHKLTCFRSKLGGAADSLKDREALQRDFHKSEDWAITNHMKFNKGNCWILHLGWGNPGCVDGLGNEMLESSAMERDLRVLVNGKLNMSHCALAARRANCVQGGIRKSISCSALVQPCLEVSVQFWSLQYKEDIKLNREHPKEGDEDGERP